MISKSFIHASLTLFLLFPFFSSAQEVIYSPFNEFDFRSGSFSVVGNVADRSYVFRGSIEGDYLDAYDADMKHLATVILDFLPRKAFGRKFLVYENSITVLYQVNDGGYVVQYGVKLDSKGRLIDKPVQLDEVKFDLIGGKRGVYSYAISKDKEHIVLYANGIKGASLHLRTIWLDKDLNKQAKSETDFEADNNIAVGEGIVNDNGRFFLPVYTPTGARDYADRVWLLSANIGGQTLDEAELPIQELFVSGMYMKMDISSDKIYIGGFYSDKKSGHFQGVVYTYYDINGKSFKDYKNIPFSDDLRGATGQRNKKRVFNDYRVKELIIKNNGGFVLIAEDFYITTRSGYGQGFGYYSWYYPTMASSIREYNYGNIIAMSCSGEGTPEWIKFIRKNQYTQEDGGLFSSFALLNTGGSLGFLYNDFNMNRSTLRLASLDIKGKLDNGSLLGYKNNGSDWLPRSGKQVSGDSFILPCLKRNQICFAKIVF